MTTMFGDASYWRKWYERRRGEPSFEWFVDATVAVHALAPLLPPAGSSVLHLGCGTSSLGPLLAERGLCVVNVDYDRSCLDLARAQSAPRAALWAAAGGSCEWHHHDMCALPQCHGQAAKVPLLIRSDSESMHAPSCLRCIAIRCLSAHSSVVCLAITCRDWSAQFDAVVDKGGLCAAIFAGDHPAAAACREAARCCAPHARMHYITDDPRQVEWHKRFWLGHTDARLALLLPRPVVCVRVRTLSLLRLTHVAGPSSGSSCCALRCPAKRGVELAAHGSRGYGTPTHRTILLCCTKPIPRLCAQALKW